MTNEEYLYGVIRKYYLTPMSINDNRISPLINHIRQWAGQYLNEIKVSGSTAKDTLIKGNTDLDLFISMKPSLNMTLKDIYNNLYDSLIKAGVNARKQNVSIGFTLNGLKIDLIPAKQQQINSNYHSLFVRKQDTWQQTNVDIHINAVTGSGRLDEIRLTKIWRNNHSLDFPSIYLELSIIEALKHQRTNQIEANFLKVLEYLRDDFAGETVLDPANTNNTISNELTQAEKNKIANQAKVSRSQQSWINIVW